MADMHPDATARMDMLAQSQRRANKNGHADDCYVRCASSYPGHCSTSMEVDSKEALGSSLREIEEQ